MCEEWWRWGGGHVSKMSKERQTVLSARIGEEVVSHNMHH